MRMQEFSTFTDFTTFFISSRGCSLDLQAFELDQFLPLWKKKRKDFCAAWKTSCDTGVLLQEMTAFNACVFVWHFGRKSLPCSTGHYQEKAPWLCQPLIFCSAEVGSPCPHLASDGPWTRSMAHPPLPPLTPPPPPGLVPQVKSAVQETSFSLLRSWPGCRLPDREGRKKPGTVSVCQVFCSHPIPSP